MILPSINAANDENILTVLNDSNAYLEEIKSIVINDQTSSLLSINQETLEEIKQILNKQVDYTLSSRLEQKAQQRRDQEKEQSMFPVPFQEQQPAQTIPEINQTTEAVGVIPVQKLVDTIQTLINTVQAAQPGTVNNIQAAPPGTVNNIQALSSPVADNVPLLRDNLPSEGSSSVVNNVVENQKEIAKLTEKTSNQVLLNQDKLGEIETNTEDLKKLDEIISILKAQVKLEKRAAELQRIQLENEKNARLEDMLESNRRQEVSPVETSQVLSRSDQRDSNSSSGNSFLKMLGLGVAGALGSLGIIGLGTILGKEIGEFLGENIGDALTMLGVDPAFGDAISKVLTENTAGIIQSFGLARLLLGRGIPGVIAFSLYKMLGLPDLTDPEVLEGLREDIADAFGDNVAEVFDKTTDVVARSNKGAFWGAIQVESRD